MAFALLVGRKGRQYPSQKVGGRGSERGKGGGSNKCFYNASSRVESLAKQLLGPDMVFDFDMLIRFSSIPPTSSFLSSKEAGSLAETPWHQDESYWLDLPDKRALSFWFPMEDAKEENGCMWFVPGSQVEQLQIR